MSSLSGDSSAVAGAMSGGGNKKVAAALAIRDIAAWMKHNSDSMNTAIAILKDPDFISKQARHKAAKELSQLQSAFVSHSSNLLHHAKLLDPVSNLSYVHARQKNEQSKQPPPILPLHDSSNQKRNNKRSLPTALTTRAVISGDI